MRAPGRRSADVDESEQVVVRILPVLQRGQERREEGRMSESESLLGDGKPTPPDKRFRPWEHSLVCARHDGGICTCKARYGVCSYPNCSCDANGIEEYDCPMEPTR